MAGVDDRGNDPADDAVTVYATDVVETDAATVQSALVAAGILGVAVTTEGVGTDAAAVVVTPSRNLDPTEVAALRGVVVETLTADPVDLTRRVEALETTVLDIANRLADFLTKTPGKP